MEFPLGDYQCVIELRSLNGKQFEWNAKLPSLLRMYEIRMRQQVQQWLQRGTVDLTVYLKLHGTNKTLTLNTELARYYYEAMTTLADDLQLAKTDLLPTLMRMPEVVASAADTLEESLFEQFNKQLEAVCTQLDTHRKAEGAMLEKCIRKNISAIETFGKEVAPLETGRITKWKERLSTLMTEGTSKTLDQNRLEQELILYIERYDITEERNRLQHHCDYFFELLADDQTMKGKKLGFLLQEIGREINTLGSKANDAGIQKIVVQMKDELEQAKEQLSNAL